MRNQHRGCLQRTMTYAEVMLALLALSSMALAQNEVRALYDASSSIGTNVAGIRTFAAPVARLDFASASDEELALYGFPPRPNEQTEAEAYKSWAKAMAASQSRWSGELKHTGLYSIPARRTNPPALAAVSATPGTLYSLNWSGVVNTNTLTKYNSKSSFYSIISEFNVPAVNQPVGSCDGGWDWEVSWNGIDGYQDQNALLQGGSWSAVYCTGGRSQASYYAWVEWYPAYDAIQEFTVYPGDDMYVETWNTSATQGYVYLLDETTGVYGTYALTPKGGAGLVGNSAEYVVERPCCRAANTFYPLANYVWDFWANSYAYTFTAYSKGAATAYYPGSAAKTTFLLYMTDDKATQVISSPAAQGKYGIFFQTENCAAFGGCTP
jgi:Peptidase A4 family